MTESGHRATIPALVQDAAHRFGADEAIVDGDLRLTFEELADRVRTMADALMRWGLRPGDRVGVWGPNIAEWAVAALGTHTAGGVVVPVNTRLKGGEASYILGRAEVRLLFTVTDFLGTDYLAMLHSAESAAPASGTPTTDPTERAAQATAAQTSATQATATQTSGTQATAAQAVVMRGPVPATALSFEDFTSHGDRGQGAATQVGADDCCHIMFTSGTTGKPKGVMLTHGAVCRAYRDWAEVVGLRRGDRYLIVNPFFHAFGLNAGILACLMTGATMVPHASFDVPSVMARIAEERISMLPGPPAIYQSILNHPDLDAFDMSSLRLAVTGAAPVPVSMIEAMRERLGFEVVVTGYGLTEASGIATMCRADDPHETISATSGRAIDGVEVRIVGPDAREMPRGEPGEVIVRGYNVTSGYLDDADATAEAIDAQGWLHTGDIATMNDAGYVTITDRLKDMFICGGFNAYPAEIESAMLEHPAVGQVAVVGRADERLGEIAHAFVVPAAKAASAPEAADELISWCRERIANYKAPRGVTFVDSLPLNASGKVLKHELRARLQACGEDRSRR